jgi:hypothetical protein
VASGTVKFAVARAQGYCMGIDERKVLEEEQTLSGLIESLKTVNAISEKDLHSNSLTMRIYVYERVISVVSCCYAFVSLTYMYNCRIQKRRILLVTCHQKKWCQRL